MRSLSVKSKIALVVAVCTVALAAVVMVVMLGAVDKANVHATESKLFAASAGVCSKLEVEDGVLLADDDVFVKGGTFTAVYDKDGHFLCGHMPAAKLDKLPFEKSGLRHYDTWTVLDADFNVEGYGEVFIRSVVDTKTTAGFVVQLKQLVTAALALTALLVVVVVYLILRRFLKPVGKMTATAEQIAAGSDLSRRIELGKSRDEFYKLGSSFNGMMNRLEESFEKERRFTSNASHELRTPISVILSESEMAMQEGRTAAERDESLQRIHAQAAHMSALVNQLLMFARADRGDTHIDFERVDMSELMELVAETGADLAVEKHIGIDMDIQPGICVAGDQGLLMRMVLNLVENAVRYGRAGGHVAISLASSDDRARGAVRDDGIGIAPDDLPHIWERFYQADAARSGLERGSGLGLSMVKFVAETHHGSVGCISELGQGSTFSFELPLWEESSG